MKIGIALSGGGAKGLAHIGVLNALDRALTGKREVITEKTYRRGA